MLCARPGLPFLVVEVAKVYECGNGGGEGGDPIRRRADRAATATGETADD